MEKKIDAVICAKELIKLRNHPDLVIMDARNTKNAKPILRTIIWKVRCS
jgi:hypothetical protein